MPNKRLNTSGDMLLSNLRYRRKWKGITSILAIFVVICTIGSLMLPAITMSDDICGLDEHIHTEKCYQISKVSSLSCHRDTLGIHSHSSNCMDADSEMICNQVDFVVHTHDSACWDADGALVCSLSEIKEHIHIDNCYLVTETIIDEGHFHDDSCYEWVTSETITCGIQESPGHAHSDDCFAAETALTCTEPESGGHVHGDTCCKMIDTLTCGSEESLGHSHDDGCYGEDGALACGLDEASGHTHGTGCYTQTAELICDEPESMGHSHDPACYTEAGSLVCVTEETPSHQHSEECYALVKGNLICTEEEREPVIEAGEPELICEEPEVIIHSHKGTCYEYDDQGDPVSLVCGMPEVTEHQHTDTCFAEKEVQTLVCEIPEHTHTDACSGSSELTEEEQAQVDALILVIDGLPSAEEVTAQLAAFDEAENAEEKDAYTTTLLEQLFPAFTEYRSMTVEQQSAVTNAADLTALEWLLPEEDTPPALTDEERAQVEEVIAEIEALPDAETLTSDLDAFVVARDLTGWETTVTDTAEKIQALRTRYDTLSEQQKEAVSNIQKLTSLETLLAGLTEPELTEEEKTAADTLTGQIEALPDAETVQAMVSADLHDPALQELFTQVQAIRAAYEEMNDLQQHAIANLAKLDRLEKIMMPLTLTEDELLAVQDVIAIIDSLPPVEEIQSEVVRLEESGELEELAAYREKILSAVQFAFESYHALSDRQRAAVTNAHLLNQYDYLLYKEETLTVSSEGFHLTILCPADAEIPAGAVAELTPLPSDSEGYAEHLAMASEALPDYNIQGTRFFDISIFSDGQKIQPKTDVTLTITFDTPMDVQVKDLIQLVHFGSEGTEVLDGDINRDNNYVYGVTFKQGSFSVSGAVATQPRSANATEVGPDSMTVEYFIYLNGKWEKVGTTTTGWKNAYESRDYVSEAQVASILGPYGFKSSEDSARTVFYQPSNAGFNSMVWSDTSTVAYGGQRIIPLSDGDNWRLFFAPDSTYNGNAANPSDILNKASNIKFYSIDVQDPQKYAFQSEAEWNTYRVVFRSGSSPTITLPKPSTGTWNFYHDGGEKNNDLKFTDNDNGTMTCTVSGLTQHLRAIPEGTTDFGPDKMEVTYLVYLDAKWHVVGKTEYGWKGNYSLGTSNMDGRDQISTDQIWGILGPYGFDATDGGNARKLAYQQKGQDACYSDTNIDETAGHLMLPLSQNGGRTGYNLYYIPNNTAEIKNVTGGNLPATSNRFWSITVQDDFHWCYTQSELDKINSMSAYVAATGEWNHFAAAAKEGTKGSVTVKRAGFAWRWHTAEKDANGDPVFPYRENQELNWEVDGDNIIVTTNENMDKQLFLDAYDNSLRMDEANPQAGDIVTVQGKNEGISFKLFNYRADINEVFYNRGLLTGPLVRQELNASNYFAFRDQESPWKYHTLNSVYDMDGYWFYSDGVPDRTMVQPNLVNGMPVLDMTHRGHVSDPVPNANKSLAVLFQGDGSGKQVLEYSCANTPLRFDTSDGYYKYDSAKNAADFSTSTQTWYVRNRVERGQDTAEKYPGYADFLPFNNCTGEKFGTTGEGVDYQYKMLDIDYWFGMTMNVNFFQGKDGKIEYNGKNAPMEFHFSGDDDVWVFLDNMLVLDIGGTHGAVDGFINFNTGLVTTAYNFGPAAGNDPDWAKAGHSSATTIYESFKFALQKQGLSGDALTSKLNEIFVSTGETVKDDYTGKSFPVYRFKDYTSHKMNFFYMERGGGSSNCAISFNLPTIPDEALIVGKELEFSNGSLTPEQIAFAKENLTYRFRVIDANGTPLFTNNTGIQVRNEALKPIAGLTISTDGEGWFTLKAGQRVQFEHMLKTLQELGLPKLEYYVQEAIPSTLVGQYDGVLYKDGGTSGDVTMNGSTEHDWVIYKTNALSPENTYTVIYTNKVDVEKMSFLQLRKEIQAGSVYSGSETFPVVVNIAGQPVDTGTKFHYTDTNEVVTADEGGVVQLQIDKTLQLSAPVMAGTQFSVKETVPDGWSLIGYTSTHGTVTNDGVNGEIPLDATVLVTITNRTNAFSLEVPVTKEFQGGKPDVTRTATFKMEQVTDTIGNTLTLENKYPDAIEDITISCTGTSPVEGNFNLEFQPNTPDSTYYYRVREISFTGDNSESFLRDDTAYVVEIETTDNAAVVKAVYVNGVLQPNTKPAFVNTYATVELPDCGGAGTPLFYVIGGLITLAALGLLLSKKRIHTDL